MNKLLTPEFRASFPSVFEPRAIKDSDKKKYSLTMLFDVAEIKKDAEQVKLWDALVKSVQSAAKEKWGEKTPANLKNPFRDGKEKEQYTGYGDGIIFITATTLTKPGLINRAGQRIIDPEEFYAGCYGRATINPYTWTYMGKSGISFGLRNIQKTGDGETLGGKTRPEDDFNSLGELPEAGIDNATALFG